METPSIPDCRENSCLHLKFTIELSSRPESALADGVEGSAVAFSWFGCNTVPCSIAVPQAFPNRGFRADKFYYH
jgi:hypothetical protein